MALPTPEQMTGPTVTESQFKTALTQLINNVASKDNLSTEKQAAIDSAVLLSTEYADTKVNEALVKGLTSYTQSLSNFSKILTLAPNSTFSEPSFMVVDAEGRILNDYKFLNESMKSTAKTVKAPVSSFEDSVFSTVSEDGYILDVNNQNPEAATVPWQTDLYVEYTHETRILMVAWPHGSNLMLRATWCPNGHNGLFNFKSMSKAPLADPSKAEWEIIQSENSDFLPPITFIATDGDTSESGTITVGGNHGTSGGSGSLTAHMIKFELYKDGLLINADFKGYAENIQTQHTNMIYAGNTVNEQRYCMQQDFHLNFTSGNIEVITEETALHNIKMYRNGGTQLIGGPWKDTAHFYGGVQQGPWVGTSTTVIQAGTKTTAPNCWATILKSNELGFCAAWVDRDYGSKKDHIGPDDYMAFKNNTSWKFYNFVVRVDAEGGRNYPSGTKFKWRGGYSYAPISIVNGIDSAFVFKKGKQDFIGYSALSNTVGNINLPVNMVGSSAMNLTAEINGFSLATTEYLATSTKLM